jgi:hypothetical protein
MWRSLSHLAARNRASETFLEAVHNDQHTMNDQPMEEEKSAAQRRQFSQLCSERDAGHADKKRKTDIPAYHMTKEDEDALVQKFSMLFYSPSQDRHNKYF